MNRKQKTRRALAFIALIATISCAALTMRAADGRDFAGEYVISNVVDLGNEVCVRLSVRVFNYSGADVTTGTLTLLDSVNPSTDYGVFPDSANIANNESRRFAGDFTVSSHEFKRWQAGTPSLRLEYTGAESAVVRRPIELSPAMEAQ